MMNVILIFIVIKGILENNAELDFNEKKSNRYNSENNQPSDNQIRNESLLNSCKQKGMENGGWGWIHIHGDFERRNP